MSDRSAMEPVAWLIALRIAAARRDARNKALEEAAQIAGDYAERYRSYGEKSSGREEVGAEQICYGQAMTASDIADDIRALKDKP